MSVIRTTHRIAAALVMLLMIAGVARADDWHFEGVGKVVAISDIHGAFDAMVRTLQSAAVLDDELAWSAADAHLVIVGDILDRGPESRAAMDLLMRLEEEAVAAGGRVHVLIGNHEAMNLIGDLRYVSREEYAAFAADEVPADREHWFEAYSAKRGNSEESAEEQRSAFDDRFPQGFFAHREAFASDGKYGSWLLSKPILIVIDGTAYVHGGLSPMIAETGLAGVNDDLRGELLAYLHHLEVLIGAGQLLPTDSFYDHPDLLQSVTMLLTTDAEVATAVTEVIRLNDSDLHSPNGPLWYRGNVACSEVIEADRLDASLRAIGAERVVIGHTPTRGRRVLERLDGRVLEVDTGMLKSYYEGQGNALIVAGDQISVIHESGEHLPSPTPHPRYVGRRPTGLDVGGIEALLAMGDIIAEREDAAGQRVVTVGAGEQRIDALFTRRAGRDFYPEVAAYRLDRLLELDMVPVAVKREIDGKEGSLQFLPAGAVDEAQRNETGQGGGATCPLPDQWDAMMVFDALIFNEARFATTIQYDPASWQLILTGHSKAFTTSKRRPGHLAEVQIKIGKTWRESLASLTEELLEERLGDVLDRKRRRALATRRDSLLELPQD